MKIALPVEAQTLDAPVCVSFGRTPLFMVVDSENEGKAEFVDNTAAAGQGGAGIKAGQLLADLGVNIVITFRCGENAAAILNAADIKLYKAAAGSASENVAKFKAGELAPLSDIHPGFHNHK